MGKICVKQMESGEGPLAAGLYLVGLLACYSKAVTKCSFEELLHEIHEIHGFRLDRLPLSSKSEAGGSRSDF